MPVTVLLKLLAAFLISCVVVAINQIKKRITFSLRLILAALAGMLLCAMLAAWASSLMPIDPTEFSAGSETETVIVTALQTKNDRASKNEIYLTAVYANGKKLELSSIAGPGWYKHNSWLIWRSKEDPKWPGMELTDSFALQIPCGSDRYLEFLTNHAKGQVSVTWNDESQVIDCYSEKDGYIRANIPDTSIDLTTSYGRLQLGIYSFIFLILFSVLWEVVLRLKIVDPDGPFTKDFIHGKISTLQNSRFLFGELVKRDFKKKYKRSVLGVVWSLLSPLLMLLVMRVVFTQFFGRTTPHYTTYLFCGNLVFSYFRESTNEGMSSLMGNSKIFTKVNIPKYLFLFSKNVQTLINFGLTLCIFFIFCIIDHITFTWKFIFLLYPIVLLLLFNIGTGLILSALFVFFRDIQYLWTIFTQLLLYLSAIFYTIDKYGEQAQNLFLLNPVYLFIRYFRKIVIEATIPSPYFHLLMLFDTLLVLGFGCRMYMKYNHRFLYYV